MTSAIDPTLAADGIPASKADLRNNLQAAKIEIETLQVEKGTANSWLRGRGSRRGAHDRRRRPREMGRVHAYPSESVFQSTEVTKTMLALYVALIGARDFACEGLMCR
jgi:hypothetical protein